MQIIELFTVKEDFKKQLAEYLEDNSGYSVVTTARIMNEGYEQAIVVFDDGE